MTAIMIGSTAIKHHFPDFPREPKDRDAFCSVEIPGVDAIWHPLMSEYWTYPFEMAVATPDELYTIKVSHSYWELRNGSWNKHMSDVVWLKDQGCELIQPLHDLLYRVWEEIHGKKRVDLSLEADDFFADAVKRLYDHDSIHESVAYGDQAMYVRYLKPGKTVAMDMQKVWDSPFEDQVKLFREEVYATALERLVIPSSYTYSPRAAYAWALRRTITSLTKGKSAQFLVENYKLFRTPDCDYVARHRANSHKLIPLNAPEVASV